MLKGVLVINHFLKSEKFDEIYKWIKDSAVRAEIKLDIYTNKDMITKIHNGYRSEECDFVLFWDKDILLAKTLENLGFRVFNSSSAIECCDDKALMHTMLVNKGISCPKTYIPPFTFERNWDVKSKGGKEMIDEIVQSIGLPMVIKARKGSFGQGVYLAESLDEIYEIVSKYEANDLLFQEFVSTSKGRDMRLQVVNDEVVASMHRYSETDFRANITNGGKMKNINPSKEAIDMALKVTKVLGLDFCGVDILYGRDDKPVLCEVNSNAHFVNIYNCTGVNVADKICEYLVKIFNRIEEM